MTFSMTFLSDLLEMMLLMKKIGLANILTDHTIEMHSSKFIHIGISKQHYKLNNMVRKIEFYTRG